MMKFHLLLLLLIAQISFAQVTKIKVKKADALYKVSIAGVDSGSASLKRITTLQQLNVTNEKDGIKIFSYEAIISQGDGETVQAFIGKNKTLSEELLKKLQETFNQGATTLRIKKILAYNSFNETIQLNDIEVKIVK